MSDDTEHRPPHPLTGATTRHLKATLRDLRRWACLTLDGLHALDRTLPRSTVSAVERGERHLTRQFASSFMTACLRARGHPPAAIRQELVRWHAALDTIRSDEDALTATGISTTPRDILNFMGRDKEIQRLVHRVTVSTSSPAILAIDGMGGVGKTALAIRLAHLLAERYPDGQLFVDLQAHTENQHPVEPAQALRRLQAMLGAVPTSRPRQPAEWAELWRAELRRKRLLVVLDDAADSRQVEPLLPGRSDSLVLVTSRKRLPELHMRGAITHRLDVLPRDAAAALFVGVVGADRADPRSTDVDRVIHRCGMLPLALRLLASRLALRPTWTVADLADEVERAENRLDVFSAENLSVRSALDQSYRSLSPGEALVLRKLGLHLTGEFSLGAATALAGVSTGQVEAALEGLAACNLIGEVARHHYRLHTLVHEYARERAAADHPPFNRPARVSRAAMPSSASLR